MTTNPAMEPIHPGEILAEEYLTPLGISQHKLAVAVGVPRDRLGPVLDKIQPLACA